VTEPLPIEFSAMARAQVHEAETWWNTNRPKSPGAVQSEFERFSSLIARHPQVGTRSTNSVLRNVRRVHLGRIHYDLYYRVAEDPARLQILALWHARRGSRPTI